MITTSVFGSALALMLGPLGVQELLIILLIAVLIFGGRKIPEVARGLGEGIRQFKASIKGDDKPDPPSSKEKESATSA